MMIMSLYTRAQQLDQMGEEKPLKVNGGINAQTVFYGVDGIEARRDPFFWVVNANLTLNFLGVSAPFSATFSSQESQFSQPFNQYGLSPKYKSVTAHLGYRSLNYSSLTLSGLQFLGAGVEWEPEDIPVYASAVYGRFAKAVDPAELAQSGEAGMAAFERWGYGAKVGFRPKFGEINLIMFRAKDDPTSITPPGNTDELNPEANLILGIEGNAKITKTTTLIYEYAHSIYTEDLYLGETKLDDFTYADNLGNLIPANASTTESNAFQLKVNQNFKKFSINAGYKRLDPNYRSMGTPFLNNDVEDITGGAALPLLKGKINLSANAGFQRDNLDESKKDRMTRLIFGGNASIRATSWWNISAAYSNFNSNTYKVRMLDLDSLDFFQVTRSLNVSQNFSFGKGNLRSTIFNTASVQRVEDSQENNSQVFNVVGGYMGNLADLKINFGVNGNYFRNEIDTIINEGFGPTITAGKRFLKNNALNVNISFTMITNRFNGERNNETQNAGIRSSYRLGEHHNFGMQLNLVRRTTYSVNTNQFTEYRATINYGFTF